MSDKKRTLRLGSLIARGGTLFALWIIFSGRFDFTHIFLGVASVAFVLFFNRKVSGMELYFERGYHYTPLKIAKVPIYLIWLVKEIIIAGLQVAYFVLHPRMPIKPTLVTFKTRLPSAEAEVILGNSITLTPGTFTIDIEHKRFLVHALSPSSTSILESDSMPRRVMGLFSDKTEKVSSEFQFQHPK